MEDHSVYSNPLIARYASPAMAELWGNQRRFSTWRRLWIALAEAEKELGLPITDEQLAEMRDHESNIDFSLAATYERRFRHDVMAHVHTFGDVAPKARPIIHLGATSCYVTDNTDLIQMREGLDLLSEGLVRVIRHLSDFARQYRDLPTLGFTHFQAAQLTTVGKRACLWLQDLLLDLEEVTARREWLPFRGVKGTTGTQATFLSLFKGDHQKVRELDRRVAKKLGFRRSIPVTGQTYTRKIDSVVLDVLSGISQTAHKLATDLRLLSHRKEVEEPFEKEQIGSSAMAYKRNPMRSERICGLARFVMSLGANTEQTAAVQWLERTLDDSANRRLVIPQAFLATDAILVLLANVTKGLVVYPKVIATAVASELPFMATEEILMAGVEKGKDRQDLHERIRQHSVAAGEQVKREGKHNDLIDRLKKDAAFQGIDLELVMDARRFVGRAPEQVDEFLAEEIEPALAKHKNVSAESAEIKV
ncbi:adenylosuccinate lyase [bacterium]|nr:adenylosuccinate lyase [bacterium]